MIRPVRRHRRPSAGRDLSTVAPTSVALVPPLNVNGVPIAALSPEQAAESLSIGRTMIYKLVKDGVVPAYQIGGRTLIYFVDLMEMRSRLTPVKPPEPGL